MSKDNGVKYIISLQQYSKFGHKDGLVSVLPMPVCTGTHVLVSHNENFHKDIDYVLSYNYRLMDNDEPLFTVNLTEKSPKIFGWLPFHLPASQGVQFLTHGSGG